MISRLAERDLEVLHNAGLRVRIDIEIYGVIEATVGEYGEQTQIQ